MSSMPSKPPLPRRAFLATGVVAVFGLIAVALVSAGATASDAQTATLAGEYYWKGGNDRGDLRAVFTATGENSWDVDFHFRFDGRPHTYSGTAEGSLSSGSLAGEVRTENRRRTFTFEGEFEDGVFRGRHAEVRDGEGRRTGTLTLTRPAR